MGSGYQVQANNEGGTSERNHSSVHDFEDNVNAAA